MRSQPRLLQTYLMDGTLEGIRIIDCESSIETGQTMDEVMRKSDE